MFARRFTWHTAGMVLAGIWCFTPAVAFAQSGETDVGELAGLGGPSFGLGTQGAVMGSAGIPISRYGVALFETTFMSIGQHTIRPFPAPSTVNQSYLYDFGVDFHIRIPVRERLAPYGIVGTGLLWNTVRQNTVDSSDVAIVKHYNQVNGVLHTGAGLRYYVGKNWGIRPEVRVIVSKQVYTQVLMGVFYVMPPGLP
jgi:hypothetical protein